MSKFCHDVVVDIDHAADDSFQIALDSYLVDRLLQVSLERKLPTLRSCTMPDLPRLSYQFLCAAFWRYVQAIELCKACAFSESVFRS